MAELSWWEEFKNSLADKKAIKLAEKVDKIDGHETIQAINKLKNELAEYKFDSSINMKFERKLRIYENRLSRAIDSKFGPLLRELRKKKGFSLAELQEKTGISASYINRMENGERKTPSISIIETLANALQVDKNRLISAANDSVRENKTVDIFELLKLNNITINGKTITDKDKDFFINIITSTFESPWTEDTKHLDIIKIAEMIDGYKRTSKY